MYDETGALGGLFAPGYIHGDPTSEAAVARWNAAHLRQRPAADPIFAAPALATSQAAVDPVTARRDAIAQQIVNGGVGGESGSMGSGESGMGHAESGAPSLGFSAPDAAPTSAPATSAPATSTPSVAAPADAPATAPAATTPATPASLSGLFGQEMGKADTVNDNIAAAIAANNNMTTIAQQYGYMENSPTNPAEKGDNLAATTTAVAPTAPAPAPAPEAPQAAPAPGEKGNPTFGPVAPATPAPTGLMTGLTPAQVAQVNDPNNPQFAQPQMNTPQPQVQPTLTPLSSLFADPAYDDPDNVSTPDNATSTMGVSDDGIGMGFGNVGDPGVGTSDGFGAGATGISGTVGTGDLGGGYGIGGLGFGMGTTGGTATGTQGAPGAGVDGFGVGATSAVGFGQGYGYGSVADAAAAQEAANAAAAAAAASDE